MILSKSKSLKTPRENSVWHKCMETKSYFSWRREKHWRHTCKRPQPSYVSFLHGDKEKGWRVVRGHNTDFISSKSTTVSERTWLNSQYSERPAVFLVPRGSFLKKKAVVTRFWQGKSPTSRSSLDGCRTRLDVWARRVWRPRSWSPAKNRLVALVTPFRVPSTWW